MPYNRRYRRNYRRRNNRSRNYVTQAQLKRQQRLTFYREHPMSVYSNNFSASVSSSGAVNDMTYNIMNNVLNSADSNMHVENGNCKCKVWIDHLYLDLTFRQSDTTLLTNDAYNYFRFVIFDSPLEAESSPTTNPIADMFQALNPEDYMKIYYDKRMYLKRTSLEGSSTTTVPGSISHKVRIPIKKSYTFIGVDSVSTLSTTIEDSLRIGRLTDSAATPHPVCDGFVNIYYRILN